MCIRDRYGDRTPKSNKAKFFAIIWFLVGLVVFGLFSAGLASDLTVVVKAGGTEGSGTSKVMKVSQHLSERVHELEFLLISYFSVDLSNCMA